MNRHTENIYDYMYENHIYDSNSKSIQSDAVTYDVVEYATILPLVQKCGGVIDSEDRLVASSVHNPSADDFTCNRDGYEVEDRDFVNETVVYLGYFTDHWGHFIVDCMCRAWILEKEEFKTCKVYFGNRDGRNHYGNYSRMLELLGAPSNRLFDLDRPTRFKKVIVPLSCINSNECIINMSFFDMYKRAADRVRIDEFEVPEKVYLSRSWIGKMEYGEESIENQFEKNDFIVLHPEVCSLDYQIAIFRKAKYLAYLNSSIGFGVLFSNADQTHIVLNKYRALHKLFHCMANYGNYDRRIVYIDIYNRFLNFWGDSIGTLPYIVSMNKNLRNYFRDNNYVYSRSLLSDRIKNIVRYLISSLRKVHGLLVNGY